MLPPPPLPPWLVPLLALPWTVAEQHLAFAVTHRLSAGRSHHLRCSGLELPKSGTNTRIVNGLGDSGGAHMVPLAAREHGGASQQSHGMLGGMDMLSGCFPYLCSAAAVHVPACARGAASLSSSQ